MFKRWKDNHIKMLILAGMLTVLTIMAVSFIRCTPYNRDLIDWRQSCYNEAMWEYNPDVHLIRNKVY